MQKEPIKNTLPPPLWPLNAREAFIVIFLPFDRVRGFVEGRFKPTENDHRVIVSRAVPFYKFNAYERERFIERKKYHAVKHFLTVEDKKTLNCPAENYAKVIDALVEKHWNKLVEQAASGG